MAHVIPDAGESFTGAVVLGGFMLLGCRDDQLHCVRLG